MRPLTVLKSLSLSTPNHIRMQANTPRGRCPAWAPLQLGRTLDTSQSELSQLAADVTEELLHARGAAGPVGLSLGHPGLAGGEHLLLAQPEVAADYLLKAQRRRLQLLPHRPVHRLLPAPCTPTFIITYLECGGL